MREEKEEGVTKHISSNYRPLYNLMSHEIGEIIFFGVSFISVGVVHLWGFVSLLEKRAAVIK